MPGNMLGAAPFQSQFLIQQQQQRDAMQQHQNQMPMQMQQQYPLSTPAPNMDPQHQLLQLQQLQQFQQLSQQSQQQQHHPSHLKKIKLQPNGSRELDDMAKRRSDDGVIAASSKKPRKIRNENKVSHSRYYVRSAFCVGLPDASLLTKYGYAKLITLVCAVAVLDMWWVCLTCCGSTCNAVGVLDMRWVYMYLTYGGRA